MNKKIILVGGGGHCKSVIDVAESAGYTILGILDRAEKVGHEILKYKVIGTDDDIVKFVNHAEFIVSVGQIKSPDLRILLHNKIVAVGGTLATIISPYAHVSEYARIGEGTVIMHHAIVNADASVGRGCIINTLADIEHDVVIGNYCHVSTGAIINGGVHIQDCTFIGSQSVVNQNVHITGGVISSLSVVNKDLSKKGVYAGGPAKMIEDYGYKN